MNQEKAIVLGGSIAGLLAARVLADHFQEVVILERDRLPEKPEIRRGTPQAQHVHFLLKRGVDIIEALFPGIFSALEQDGAESLDMTRDLNMYLHGNWRIPFESGVTIYSASRALLEHHIRQRVSQIANIRLQDGCAVKGYVLNPAQTRLTAVRYQQRLPEKMPEQTMTADLIVDATGLGSRTPQWLEALGFPRVTESKLKIDVQYATARFRVPPAHAPAWKAVAIYMDPPGKRIGASNKIEGDQYIVTLVGKLGDVPPTEHDAFRAYAQSLPQADLYDLLMAAEPLSDIVTYRLPANLRRHYEKMAAFPEGFVVTGAAVCAFNPSFAQGMTAAALEAMAIDSVLRKQGLKKGVGRQMQKAVAKAVDIPWMMATSEDMRHPDVGVKVPMMNRFMNWYTKQVQNVAAYDTVAHRVFMDVMNMVSPPTQIFMPRVLVRVVNHVLRRKQESRTTITAPVQATAAASGK